MVSDKRHDLPYLPTRIQAMRAALDAPSDKHNSFDNNTTLFRHDIDSDRSCKGHARSGFANASRRSTGAPAVTPAHLGVSGDAFGSASTRNTTSDADTDKKATSTKPVSLRLRGAGGESATELAALDTLSIHDGELFKRLVRKCLILLRDEDKPLSQVLSTYSLRQINMKVEDVAVAQKAWEANGCQVTWNDDEFEIGVIQMWNEERNYGVIVRMDGCAEVFCHGSNFVDGDDCTLDVGDLVWMRVEYDDDRDRDQAVEIEAATEDDMHTFADEADLSHDLQFFGHMYDQLNGSQAD